MFLIKSSLGVIAGLASVAFVGYCIYFDKKRRSHPDFKKNLYERRRRNKKTEEQGPPSMYDQRSVERYFMQEIRRGEQLINEGKFELGADHLMNAIVVCNKPGRLLSVLQSTLPVPVFANLVCKLSNLDMNSAPKAPAMGDNFNIGLIQDDGSVE